MENKKTKLTISGTTKKSFKNFKETKFKDKKTVIIDRKQINKYQINLLELKKPHLLTKKYLFRSQNFLGKTPSITSDFEKRKLAEQRATKRLKDDNENKDKKTKLGTKKREVKLTVSRALSDEIETRERSLASVKRARQKELKNAQIKMKIKKIKNK